jgi:thioredoxin 1
MSVHAVTKENFQIEVMEEKLPVLVKFYTEGCGPCEALVPVLEELAEALAGKLKITGFYVSYEDGVERTNEIVEKYEIMGFPSLLIFKNGELVKSLIGYHSEDELLEELNGII